MDEIDRETIAQALDALTAELICLRMEQTVQRTALTLLVRHLSRLGKAQIEVLAQDLEAMGATQTAPGWQDRFAQLAGELRLLHARPARARPRGPAPARE